MSTVSQKESGILLTAGNNEVEFMEFSLGGTSYGVNVAKILRVVGLRETPITRVAEAPPEVLGVVYDQTRPLKLIDLKRALKIEEPAKDEDRRLVLITHFNTQSHAFLIDAVHKIHRTSWDKLQPMSAALNAVGYVTGTIQLDGRIVLVLDLERLVIEQSPRQEHETRVVSEGVTSRRATRRIVFAEDSPTIRRMTVDKLREAGYTGVSAFDNGEAAWNHLTAQAEEARRARQPFNDYVQVLLTDIEMPRLDGLTLCKRVKTDLAGQHAPPVLVYSSLITEEMRRKCKAVGTDRELSKPNAHDIVHALDEILFGESLEARAA